MNRNSLVEVNQAIMSLVEALYTKQSSLGCNIGMNLAKTCRADQIGHALM